MDWDVDMDDVGPEALQEAPHDPQPDPESGGFIDHDPSAEPGLIVDNEVVPNKIHIRGLDTLTTEDLKAYVADNYGPIDRVEWVDDTSANLVFSSESTAQEALVALSVMAIADVTQLPPLECLAAKPLTSKPEINLQIRFAVADDKKVVGAAARSRFYLLHPEYDPEERRRRERGSRGRYRERDRDGYGDRYRRRGRDRRDDDYVEQFDASLYDDDEATVAERSARERRRRRYTPEDSDSETPPLQTNRNRDKELFPERRPGQGGGAARGRSASPLRDLDGDEAIRDASQLPSSSKNRTDAASIRAGLRSENSGKELFPTRAGGLGKAQIDQLDAAGETTRLIDRTLGFPLEEADRGTSNGGRRSDGSRTVDAFSIRGVASQRPADGGLVIKGAAAASARELFPDKLGNNTGKELFASRLDGRARRRQRADDFH